MKKMRKMFYIMECAGMVTFMAMMFMMLFISFTAMEVAIPFIIGCVGLIGETIIKYEMAKKSKRIRVRKRMVRA